MKQQNYVFVEIVSSIFLLILLIGNFLGLLYITEGNIVMSLLSSLFLIICYYFVIQQLKKNKEEMIRKSFLHPSLLFVLFFFLLSFGSFYLTSHFVNIEYNCKSLIQKEATEKLNFVQNLSVEYKNRADISKQNFGTRLQDNLENYALTKNKIYLDSLLHPPFNFSAQTLVGITASSVEGILEANLTPVQTNVDTNVSKIQKTIFDNNKLYQSVFDDWKRLVLMDTYSKLNGYVKNNITLVNSKVADLPVDNNPIETDSVFQEKLTQRLPLNSPSELNIIYPPNYVIPLIAILLIHLFILIPFFTEKIRITDSIFERIVLLFQPKRTNPIEDALEIENVRNI